MTFSSFSSDPDATHARPFFFDADVSGYVAVDRPREAPHLRLSMKEKIRIQAILKRQEACQWTPAYAEGTVRASSRSRILHPDFVTFNGR